MAAICVFCSSSQAIDRSHLDVAAAVGAEIARRGHSLVSGGGSVSMMGAVAKAARDGGAHTTGVLPELLAELEVADRDVDEFVVTTDLRDRKTTMADRSTAFIVLPGGIGTLEELFEMWVARTLQLHTKPLVICDPLGVFEPLRKALVQLHGQGFIRAHAMASIVWTVSAVEAVDAVEAGLRQWPFGDDAALADDAIDVLETALEAE